MLTEANGASALRSRRVSESRKKRRADGTPYGAAGSAHRPLSDDEDVPHAAPIGEKRGFFSRLVSYLPIVGKLVPEEDQATDADHEMREDLDEEIETVDLIEDDDKDLDDDDHQYAEEVTETVEAEQTTTFVASNGRPRDEDAELVGSETVRGPSPALDKESPDSVEVEVERRSSVGSKRSAKSPSTATSHNPQDSSPSPPVRSRRVKSPSRERSADKTDMAPSVRPHAFLPASSQRSKTLHISANRRRKSSSPSPSDSEKTQTKQKKKKAISYADYERVSRQLQELGEPTTQSALALTTSTLEEDREDRGSPNGTSYVPGSLSSLGSGPATASAAGQAILRIRNGEDSGASLTFRRRIGVNVNVSRPITFSGPAMGYAHEERLGRRSRPSRLLTGAQRDATTRSAYSAAVAEKILATLKKIQNPLEREAKKPRPSTSLSWAKYHLALMGEAAATPRGDEDAQEDQQNPPPTSTLPRVLVSQTQQPPSKSAFKTSTGDVDMQDVISITASPPRSLAKTVTMGEFTFTLPRKTLGRVDEDEDMSIQFEFSPPPALREPPKKASTTALRLPTGTAAPFSFMPPSPKEKTTWMPKSVPPKKPAETPKAQESAPKTAAATVPVSSGSNPLARFMQVAPGTWKCPTCAVANEDKFPKCPCCDTAKPAVGDASTKPAASAAITTSTGSSNPLARFMQPAPGTWKCPSCAVSNQDKYSKCPCCETAKPGGTAASSASTSAPSTSSSSPAPSGFSFDVTSGASASAGAVGSITPGGFSFGAPPASDKCAATASTTPCGFSFGVAPTSEKPTSEASASSTGFSFGFAAPEKKADAKSPTPIENKTSGFSFGVPSEKKEEAAEKLSFSFSAPVQVASAATVEAESTKAPVPAFTFSAPTTTAKTPSTQPAFSFNAGTAAATGFMEAKSSKRKADEPSKSPEKPSTGFSFGVAPTESAKTPEKPATSEWERPAKKRIAPAMTTEKQPAAPAFAFGSLTPEPTAKPPAPTFGGSFGAASSSSASPLSVSFGVPKSDEKLPATVSFTFGSTPAPSTSRVNFGASTDAKASSPAASSSSSAPSTGFSFGAPARTNAAAPTKPAITFGVPATESKPTVSFGAAPSTSNDKPAFSFGQSATSSSTSSSSLTTFGASSTPATTSGFGFTSISSAPSATASSTPAATSSAPSFTFGSSSTQPPASSASDTSMSSSGFGVASSSPSPAFGMSTTTSAFGQTSSAASPAFGQSTSAASPAFGQSTSAPSTAFGQSASAPSSAFGRTANAPSPAFGQSTNTAAFGQTPSPAFGQTSSQQQATTFGSAGGFRSISPAAPTQTTTFGVGAAGASTSPSFGFGSSGQTASAPAAQHSFGFGAAPTTTFGAPAVSSGFGSAPSAPVSSGFGTGFGQAAPAPTTFGSQTPAAPGFGAANPATTFGAAPAFGSAPSGFGAPAGNFGAAPAAGGFGAAPAAAAPAFGAPAPAFGAPAGAFGAPAPAAGAFGAPQADNSFSMGAAPPQHAKGRRILRAKARRGN